jgi:hypothetical protein
MKCHEKRKVVSNIIKTGGKHTADLRTKASRGGEYNEEIQ